MDAIDSAKVLYVSSIYREAVIGISAGVAVAVLVYFFQKVWKRILEPWFEERVYRDAKVEGKWEGRLVELCEPTGDYLELISLERRAHRITGTITCTGGADIAEEYALEGTFRNLLLSGTYWQKSRRSLDRGSFTLKLTENGERLEGHCAYYNTPNDCVQCSEYSWTRKHYGPA